MLQIMRYFYIGILALILLNVTSTYAQDIITKRNKAYIQAKVIDSSANEIIFKEFFNQDGPTYSIAKVELYSVHYESGKLEIYKDFKPAKTDNKPAENLINLTSKKEEDKQNDSKIEIVSDGKLSKDSIKEKQEIISISAEIYNRQDAPLDEKDYYELGKKDAKLFYKSYKDAAIITFLVSAIPIYGIPLGLTSGLAISLIPPSSYNLHYPNQKLMENDTYRYGYKMEAQRIKRKKVWKNYGLGVATGSVILIGAVIALYN